VLQLDHQDEEAKKLVKQAFKGRDTSLYSPLLHLSNVTRYEGGGTWKEIGEGRRRQQWTMTREEA
jgi:hypothetical protein